MKPSDWVGIAGVEKLCQMGVWLAGCLAAKNLFPRTEWNRSPGMPGEACPGGGGALQGMENQGLAGCVKWGLAEESVLG